MEKVAPILEAANDHPYISLASAVLGCAALIRLVRRRRYNLPPGPKGYPIIGNLFDMPPTHSWEKFGEFGKLYGALPILCCYWSVSRRERTLMNLHAQVGSHISTSWARELSSLTHSKPPPICSRRDRPITPIVPLL